MGRSVQHIVASYDISDPKRLARVAGVMKDYGERVLKSVFECNLTEAQFLKMKGRVDDEIDHTEDSVRFYFACEKCVGNIDVVGLGGPFADDEEVVIA